MSFLAERLLFLAALPVVAIQGPWVKLTAPRFAPAAGAREGTVGEGASFRLLAIGDSVVAGIGIEQMANALPGRLAATLAAAVDRRVEWRALGVAGMDAVEIRSELVPQLPDEPLDCVFLSVGVNDVTGLRTVGRWRRELSGLVGDLRSHSPEALIIVSGLPPVSGFPLLPQPLRAVLGLRARTFDAVAEETVSTLPGVVFLPNRFDPQPEFFAPDGYHPSEESCRIWSETITEAVVEWLMDRDA